MSPVSSNPLSSTGRLTSGTPRMQSIPMRTPEGRLVREALAAGRARVSADYSRIELRAALAAKGE